MVAQSCFSSLQSSVLESCLALLDFPPGDAVRPFKSSDSRISRKHTSNGPKVTVQHTVKRVRSTVRITRPSYESGAGGSGSDYQRASPPSPHLTSPPYLGLARRRSHQMSISIIRIHALHPNSANEALNLSRPRMPCALNGWVRKEHSRSLQCCCLVDTSHS